MGHLSFDRFNDNQVISLEYNENARGVKSGLTFYDRPGDGSFQKSLAKPERIDELNQELRTMSSSQRFGVERVFIGSRNEVPQLVLKDTKGRVRARLLIDDRDEPRLEFLDEAGEVTNRFPE